MEVKGNERKMTQRTQAQDKNIQIYFIPQKLKCYVSNEGQGSINVLANQNTFK